MDDLVEMLRKDADLIHNNGITRKLPRHRVAALLREAAAALEAAREDGARLDWMASQAETLWGSRDRGGYELPYFNITSGRECCEPGDLRAAIDQARGKGATHG